MASAYKKKYSSGVVVVEWTLTTADNIGDAVSAAAFPEKSVQVSGTFGGGTVTLQGTNDASDSPSQWNTLTSPVGMPVSLSSAGVMQICENTFKIRPVITGSTGASVIVRLCMKS